MSQKFRFNVNRLEFEKVTRPVWYFLLKGVKYFLVTVSLAVCYYIVFALVVDTDTEKRLLHNLISQTQGTRTVIFITHRPAIVEHCSHVLHLNRGQ